MSVNSNVLGIEESGNTPRFFATIKQNSGSYSNVVTPDSLVCQIFSGSNGILYTAYSGSATYYDTGIYYVDFQIPIGTERNNWVIEWDALVGGNHRVSRRAFTVVKTGT